MPNDRESKVGLRYDRTLGRATRGVVYSVENPEQVTDELLQQVELAATPKPAPPAPKSVAPEGPDILSELRQQVRNLLQDPQYKPPTLPQSATQLASLSADPNAKISDLAQIVRNDPNVTATVMRAANSVGFGGVGSIITSIDRAIVQLGLESLRSISFAAAMKPVFLQKTGQSRLLKKCFKHSVAVATGSSALAKKVGLDQGTAFVAGMLHDIGKVVVLHALDKMPGNLGESITDQSLLHKFLSQLHCDVGALIISRWKLPQFVHDISEDHHASQEQRTGMLGLVSAVNVYSRTITLSLHPQPDDDTGIQLLCMQGLSLDEVGELGQSMQKAVAVLV